MLKDLAKAALTKERICKYNRTVNAKSSAYDKWQHAIEREPVAKAKAPVIMETLETGEVVPHIKPEPKVKVIHYAKVWDASSVTADENVIYLFVSSKGKLTKRAIEVIKQLQQVLIRKTGINHCLESIITAFLNFRIGFVNIFQLYAKFLL